MSAENLARRVLRAIEEKAQSLRVSILGGAPRDYAEYRRIAGELRGLESAAQIVRDELAPELDDGRHSENRNAKRLDQ